MNLSHKITNAARGFVLAFAVGLITSFSAWGQGAGAAANSLEAISVAGQQGGNIVVKITFRQPLANHPRDSPSTIPRASPSTSRTRKTGSARTHRRSVMVICAI